MGANIPQNVHVGQRTACRNSSLFWLITESAVDSESKHPNLGKQGTQCLV